MSLSYRNVCEVIVPNDLCIGCGLCTGVCPPNVLEMQFNEYGEYIPIEFQTGCLPKCDLCLRACPFWDQEDNEDTLGSAIFGTVPDVQHRPETGYYQQCYAGYTQATEQRMNSTSGGLATWFLQKLLQEQIVDKVICVRETSDPEKQFQFEILESAEAVGKGSRSCYYPVEIGSVIRQILKTDGRYAITGLPCFLKGIRLAMCTNRRLRKRVVALVGLTCGQTKSKFFVEYLAMASGAQPDVPVRTEFRIKDPKRPATDYGHRFTWQNGSKPESGTIFWTEGIREAWNHGYFKPNACNFCDDVFAEVADVTFMDGWLPQYTPDYRGHSLVINRNPAFNSIWETSLSSDEVHLERIDIDSVIRSQRSVLTEKRDGMQYRLLLAEQEGRMTPHKRFAPESTGTFLDRHLWRLKSRVNRQSRILWSNNKNVENLHNALVEINLQIRLIYFAKRIIRMFQDGRTRSALQKRIFQLTRKGIN